MAKKRKSYSRSPRKVKSSSRSSSSKRKVGIILGNLILSVVLLAVSMGLYYVVSDEVLKNLFWMLSLIFGFVGLAFFITYLVFFFSRVMRKR